MQTIKEKLLGLVAIVLVSGALGAQAEDVRLSKDGGVYHLPVRINDAIELKFIVDTGAADVHIPADVALTLIRTGTISKADFLGTAQYQMADGTITENAKLILRSLKIGSTIIRNVEASIGPVEGSLLLGQSALGEIEPWRLDTKREVFVFGESASRPPKEVANETHASNNTHEEGVLYFAAELAPTANIPPEAPLCYKFIVASPEEQLRKLKAKYPGLYDARILTNPKGGKNLVAKRRDETGKDITYFYSTTPRVCNTYQNDRLQTPAPPGARAGANAASPPGRAKASAGSDNSPHARYRFLGKDQNIVEDTHTKLQWQRCSLGQTWTGATCAGEATTYKWDEAQRVAPAGWRLPTKEELASLIYCSSGQPAYWKSATEPCKGVYTSPTIWSAAFPDTPKGMFWSSSPHAGYSYGAWIVDFYYGSVYYGAKSNARCVRLVRGGQ